MLWWPIENTISVDTEQRKRYVAFYGKIHLSVVNIVPLCYLLDSTSCLPRNSYSWVQMECCSEVSNKSLFVVWMNVCLRIHAAGIKCLQFIWSFLKASLTVMWPLQIQIRLRECRSWYGPFFVQAMLRLFLLFIFCILATWNLSEQIICRTIRARLWYLAYNLVT